MRYRVRQNYSSLFEGMIEKSNRGLDLVTGRGVLRIGDGEVFGERMILERVREGLIRNGGYQRIFKTNI